MSDKQQNDPLNWKTLYRVCVAAFITFACCTLFYFFVLRFKGLTDLWKTLTSAAQPIIIGVILAYIMNPVEKRLEKRIYPLLGKISRSDHKARKHAKALGITGTTICLLAVIALAIWTVAPAIATSVIRIVRMMPYYVNHTLTYIENSSIGENPILLYLADQINQAVDKLSTELTTTMLPKVQTYLTQITSGVISVLRFLMNFVIGIIVMIYCMAIQDTLRGQMKKVIYALCSPKAGNMVVEVIRKTNEVFGGFFAGKILDSAIIGVIAYVSCRVMKIPDAILVASIIGITNIIPFFGPFIGAVPTLLLVVIQSPWHALYLLIFIIILQQVDGNIIGPNILGNSTGLSSLWIMVAILVGGGLFGFAGMILGVPAFAVLYYILKRLINYMVGKKKLPTDTGKYTALDYVDIKSGKIVYKDGTEK